MKVSREKHAGNSKEKFCSRVGSFTFYSLVTLIALAAIPYGTVEPWWKSLFEIAVFLLVIIATIESVVGGEMLTRHCRVLTPLLCLAGFALIQSLNLIPVVLPGIQTQTRRSISSDFYQTRMFAVYFLALILAAGLMMRYGSTERRLRVLVYLVIGVGTASAIFGLIRQTTQHDLGFFLPLLQPNMGYGQFINKNHFAFLMEMTLGLTLGLIFGGGVRPGSSVIYLAPAVICWAALILSGSRGGIVGGILVLLFIFLFRFLRMPMTAGKMNRQKRHLSIARAVALLIASLCILFVAALTIVWVGGEPVVSRFEVSSSELGQTIGLENSKTTRADIWKTTWKLVKAHPIAGVGFGGYWAIVPGYHDAPGIMTPQEAHNDYLELLASGGIIGVSIFVWALILFIIHARRVLKSPHPLRRSYAFGALAGILGVGMHSLVDFGLHVSINALLFFVLVVLATREGVATPKSPS